MYPGGGPFDYLVFCLAVIFLFFIRTVVRLLSKKPLRVQHPERGEREDTENERTNSGFPGDAPSGDPDADPHGG